VCLKVLTKKNNVEVGKLTSCGVDLLILNALYQHATATAIDRKRGTESEQLA